MLPGDWPGCTICALGKLLITILFLVFSISANAGDCEFSASKMASLTQQETTSYQHFALTKKSDAPSQIHHLFSATANRVPNILIGSLLPIRHFKIGDLVFSLFTLDIPPPA